jgi:hypothetical protein
MPIHTATLLHPSLESRTFLACHLQPAPEFALLFFKIQFPPLNKINVLRIWLLYLPCIYRQASICHEIKALS